MQNKTLLVFVIIFFGLSGCRHAGATDQSRAESESFTVTVPSLTSTTKSETARPVPTATQIFTTPIISSLEGQIISDGEQFAPVNLDEYLLDEGHHPDEIVWNHSGANELDVRIARRVLIVSPPHANWIGRETITLEACNPDRKCATTQLIFEVELVNDAPVVAEMDDQVIFPGEEFSQIRLDKYVVDPDNSADEIIWRYSGNSALDIQVHERVLSIKPADEAWRGVETIQLIACDLGDLCDTAEIDFMMQEPDDLKITFVANAGFLIEAGEKKVAIDALLQPWEGYQSLSVADVVKMEKARWPFDGIDLIIITHDHFDHYAAGVINAYLNSNPDSIALSTERVVENLRVVAENDEIFLDRMIGKKVRSGESFRMILDGIGVELLNFPHGPGAPKNLGVILSIGGFRVLHTGDLDPDQTLDVLTQYEISEKEIDVALVPAFWMFISRYQPFLEEIDVSYIIPMHFDPATSSMIDTMQADFPEAIFFRNIYESWELLR